MFAELQLDAFSSGQTDQERLSRSEEAHRILNKYPIDETTGQPDPEDVTLIDNAHVTALVCGIQSIEIPLTIKAAFDFYLSERKEPDPYKRKKQVQRFERAKRNLLAVTKQDVLIKQVGRAHARKLRDNLLQKMSPASAKRNVTDVKSVFSLVIKEHDLNINNPFSRLEYPKTETAAVDRRLPLPKDIIEAMYQQLTDKPVLLDIWTLMHHTGAQNAEILGLKTSDLHLNDDVPHFEIKPHGLRTVKSSSRIRRVPLVGLALCVAQRLEDEADDGGELFPQYAATSSHDNFSQTMRKQLKRHTDNRKHVLYSLRHNMKDALRDSKAGHRVELAILGHSGKNAAEAQYGSAVSLEQMKSALLSIDFAVPNTVAKKLKTN